MLDRPSVLPFVAALASLLAGRTSAQCLEWAPGFHMAGLVGQVGPIAVHDDGSGPALYVSRIFGVAGEEHFGIVRYDGATWSSVGPQGSDTFIVEALAVFDDGQEPALYAGGGFTQFAGVGANRIARWDGVAWAPLGAGLGGSGGTSVHALAVYDDGAGPALYAGGQFGSAGGVPTSGVARWDGTTWSALGGGTSSAVYALAVFDDGAGPALYAAGVFTSAGGAPANRIARWDGASWSPLGAGLGSGTNPGGVLALGVHDDGSGPALYAGGTFTTAGGAPAQRVARWDGSAWSAVGAGVPCVVRSFVSYDHGAGPVLYAGADSCNLLSPLYRWDGAAWSDVGPPFGNVRSFATFDAGSGPQLFVDGGPAGLVAPWDGSQWGQALGGGSGVGDGSLPHVSGTRIDSALVFDDGSGPALYAGGWFEDAGGQEVGNVARWDGSSWSAVGANCEWVRALAAFDDGTGLALYATGEFAVTGETVAAARWNGVEWERFGGGVTGIGLALEVLDDGTGPALFASGSLSISGGAPVHIARWDGTAWTGYTLPLFGGNSVDALAVFDDGTGPALYVAGSFPDSPIGCRNIARWDGGGWSALAEGTVGDVHALAVFDDGSGAKLYAGTEAGGAPTNLVVRWDGTRWESVPGPFAGSATLVVNALTVYDEGSGPVLIAGGDFTSVGGLAADRVARWDGASWTALGGGVVGPFGVEVRDLAVFDAGAGEADLFVVGYRIESAGDPALPSRNIARWRGCGHPGEVLCLGDGTGAPCPCANFGLPGHGCRNSSTIQGAELVAGGLARLGLDSLSLTSSFEPPGVTSVVLQGDQVVAPLAFGDGLRCAGGSLKRLYVLAASPAGTLTAPEVGAPSISARSAALGDPIAAGTSRVYQVYYRDPDLAFCPPPAGNSWNASNALRIGWMP